MTNNTDLRDFHPASQAYKQAKEDLDGAFSRGEVTTLEEMKSYFDERLTFHLEQQLEKITIKANKSQIVGLVQGALLSFLGGMFASSIFWWVSTKTWTSVIIGWACGIAFIFSLIIIIKGLKKIPSS